MKDSFIFHRRFYESLEVFEPEVRLQIWEAIFEFVFNGVEPELNGASAAFFELIKMQIPKGRNRKEYC